jgi:hypothetical protein
MDALLASELQQPMVMADDRSDLVGVVKRSLGVAEDDIDPARAFGFGRLTAATGVDH